MTTIRTDRVLEQFPTVNASYVNEKIKRKFNEKDSIYSIAPEITNPHVPLKDNLQQIPSDSIKQKSSLLQKKPSKEGLSGRVKFVKFKDDPQDRWVAIKRPLEKNIWANVNIYKFNIKASKIVGDHRNFMKAYGLVVKETVNEHSKRKVQKPYLILEYIEGTPLKDVKDLPASIRVDLLRQFKDALLYLYDQGLSPGDVHADNILITEDFVLKFIDFDEWCTNDPIPLVHELHEAAIRVCPSLTSDRSSPRRAKVVDRDSLERALDEYIDLV